MPKNWGQRTGDAYQLVDEILVPKVEELSADGLIDDASNLAGSPVAIISGDYDWVVPPLLQRQQEAILNSFGANVKFIDKPISHDTPRSNAKDILDHIYGNLTSTADRFRDGVKETDRDDESWKENGVLLKFD